LKAKRFLFAGVVLVVKVRLGLLMKKMEARFAVQHNKTDATSGMTIRVNRVMIFVCFFTFQVLDLGFTMNIN